MSVGRMETERYVMRTKRDLIFYSHHGLESVLDSRKIFGLYIYTHLVLLVCVYLYARVRTIKSLFFVGPLCLGGKLN